MDFNASKRQQKWLLILLLVFIIYSMMSIDCVFAESSRDAQITTFLERNDEIFNNNNIVRYTARQIGWAIVSFLVWIADVCSSLYDTAFGFIDFTSWDAVNKFTESFKPLFFAVMALSLFALGIMMTLMHNRRPKILLNICIACFCITCSTVAFQEINDLTFSLKKGIENIGTVSEHESEAYMVIDDSLVDLVVLSDRFGGLEKLNYSKNGKKGSKYTNPGITSKNFKYIDYTEVLNPKSDQYAWDSSEKEILSKKLYFKESLDNGIVDVKNGFGWNSSDDADLANEFYYRYTFSFFTAILKLISYIIVYVCMSYKCVRIAYELVVAKVFAIVYSAELSGGEKISKILVFIRDSYVLLVTTTLCIRLYGLLGSFISENVDSSVAEVIFLLFAAFCVIDGPNLVEKLLGMDAGLSSSVSRMMATYGMVKTAAGVVAAPARAAGSYAVRMHEQKKFIDKMGGSAQAAAFEKAGKGNGESNANTSENSGAEYTGSRNENSYAETSDSRGEMYGASSGSESHDANASGATEVGGAGHMMYESNMQHAQNDKKGFDPGFMDKPKESGRTSYFNNATNERRKENSGRSDAAKFDVSSFEEKRRSDKKTDLSSKRRK